MMPTDHTSLGAPYVPVQRLEFLDGCVACIHHSTVGVAYTLIHENPLNKKEIVKTLVNFETDITFIQYRNLDLSGSRDSGFHKGCCHFHPKCPRNHGLMEENVAWIIPYCVGDHVP